MDDMLTRLYTVFVIIVVLSGCSKNELDDLKPYKSNRLSVQDVDFPYSTSLTLPSGLFCSTNSVLFKAGQSTVVGTIEVRNDSENYYVTYNTTGGWTLSQTHLYVGTDAGIPKNPSGNPVPGQFPVSTSFSNGVTSVTYIIPAYYFDLCFTVAAHASVKKGNATESAWGDGERIKPGNGNWATKFAVCPLACQP